MSKKKKTRRRFSEEFKAETVKLVKQSDRSKSSIAMELGINAKSIGEWVRRAEESGDTVDEDERAELKRLRKEVRELRMERSVQIAPRPVRTLMRNIRGRCTMQGTRAEILMEKRR